LAAWGLYEWVIGCGRPLIPLHKSPSNRRVSTEQRPFHHDVKGALEEANQPLSDDVRHECVCVMLALAAFEFQREG
jgi:hypothetical protein